jgi:hypothetical protein
LGVGASDGSTDVRQASRPWWAKPPHQITPEELDRVARFTGRAAGLLEVAGAMVAEVAA